VNPEDNLYYIEIDKELIPYRFDITLAGEVFLFDVRYNEQADVFTVDLFDVNEDPIVYGEPLVLGQPLFSDLNDERLPLDELTPLDLSGRESRVTYDNLGKTVFLYDLSETDSDGESEDE